MGEGAPAGGKAPGRQAPTAILWVAILVILANLVFFSTGSARVQVAVRNTGVSAVAIHCEGTFLGLEPGKEIEFRCASGARIEVVAPGTGEKPMQKTVLEAPKGADRERFPLEVGVDRKGALVTAWK